MENQKLGQEPAFPIEVRYEDGRCIPLQTGSDLSKEIGISKRLYLAGMAMQGLLSSGKCPIGNLDDFDIRKTVKSAYRFSDELLRQEDL